MARDSIPSVPELAGFLFGSPLLQHGLGGVMSDGAYSEGERRAAF